jgi:hypothetical protein
MHNWKQPTLGTLLQGGAVKRDAGCGGWSRIIGPLYQAVNCKFYSVGSARQTVRPGALWLTQKVLSVVVELFFEIHLAGHLI